MAGQRGGRDAAQPTQALWPMYAGGGALLDGSRYLVGEGTVDDWTFLHRPGVLFMVFRPDAAVNGYLLGTVSEAATTAGTGYGIYFDAATTPPRLRFRASNGTTYGLSLNTTTSFPLGGKTVIAASLSDTKLEVFKGHDSIGSLVSTGALSPAAPYSVALVGAKASTTKTPLPGAIFEVAHYSGVLSQRARQTVAQYLADKHGVDGTPGHRHNGVLDGSLGEVAADCGGPCGCRGACVATCGVTVRNFSPSDDGTYYDVNLLRRHASFPQPQASATFANGAALWQYGVGYTMDGDDFPFRWASIPGSDPDATATVVYDLGFETSIGAVRHRYGGTWIISNRARVRIGRGPAPITWTEVSPDTPLTLVDSVTTFPGTVGRYIELTMIGTPSEFGTSGGRGVVDVTEVYAYPSTDVFPGPNTSQGYDLAYLSSASATVNSNVSGWYWTVLDKLFTGIKGRTVAEGATGDAQVTVDLGGVFQVSTVGLVFHLSLNWTNGGKIQLGVDGPTPGTITWTQGMDTGLGGLLSTNLYQVTPQLARYVRVTNYFVAGQGASTGQLDEISVF